MIRVAYLPKQGSAPPYCDLETPLYILDEVRKLSDGCDYGYFGYYKCLDGALEDFKPKAEAAFKDAQELICGTHI